MSAFPNSPRLVKGGIVPVDPDALAGMLGRLVEALQLREGTALGHLPRSMIYNRLNAWGTHREVPIRSAETCRRRACCSPAGPNRSFTLIDPD